MSRPTITRVTAVDEQTAVYVVTVPVHNPVTDAPGRFVFRVTVVAGTRVTATASCTVRPSGLSVWAAARRKARDAAKNHFRFHHTPDRS